jgi:hypothetical protein
MWSVQKFLIYSKNIDFYENFNKITITVPKKIYKEAFTHYSLTFIRFTEKN